MDARLATAHSLTGNGYDWKRPAYIYLCLFNAFEAFKKNIGS